MLIIIALTDVCYNITKDFYLKFKSNGSPQLSGV